MHTRVGAAYGRDGDAPELRLCASFEGLKVEQNAARVNGGFFRRGAIGRANAQQFFEFFALQFLV
jgi:hypothetical protein